MLEALLAAVLSGVVVSETESLDNAVNESGSTLLVRALVVLAEAA